MSRCTFTRQHFKKKTEASYLKKNMRKLNDAHQILSVEKNRKHKYNKIQCNVENVMFCGCRVVCYKTQMFHV